MGLLLSLGNFTCDEKTIDKPITWNETSRNCVPYTEVYFDDRTALLTDYNAGDEGYNYAKVVSGTQTDKTRYYYIRDRAVVTGGKILFILEFDPLMTYKDDIYKLPCVCIRTDNAGEGANQVDAYIYDSKLPVRAYRAVDEYTTTWPVAGVGDFSLDGNNNIIITAG